MADATDPTFYDRADAHIELSNEQLQAHENLGQVSHGGYPRSSGLNEGVSGQ